jgi:hypothetical protein
VAKTHAPVVAVDGHPDPALLGYLARELTVDSAPALHFRHTRAHSLLGEAAHLRPQARVLPVGDIRNIRHVIVPS